MNVGAPAERHRYDLHMHSHHSVDCMMSPRAIVGQALARGLRGIAVTDHGTIRGGVDTAAIAPAELLVIVGAEIHTSAGDIVGLFLEREIVARDALAVIEEIHAQGGVAILPHPLRGHKGLTDEVLDAVDGFEVLNSRAGWFDPATAAPEAGWSRLGGKARLGSSDAHLVREVGQAHTELAGPPTAANVRTRLLAGEGIPGGAQGPSANFYRSQLIKLFKTRDVGMVLRFGRRLIRRLGVPSRHSVGRSPH